MIKQKLKICTAVLLSAFYIFDTIDLLNLLSAGDHFLYVQVVGSFISFPFILTLFFLSLSLRKSSIHWQRMVGVTGISIVIANILVNAVALIWNLMK